MGYRGGMKLPEDATNAIISRLRKAEGQIRGIQAMIADGRDCTDVITQFAAATKAVEQAGFKFFAATLAECTQDPETAATEGYTADKLEKLFLQLA
jgi:DNA-binding FrmR family transcriptional regulator